jgi:putative addiction module component (TIGR02574 family)
MGDAAKKLFEDGLNLPEDERLDLASALWASVAFEPDADWEHAWKAEIERRCADPRPSVSWDDVRRSLRAKLAKP